MVRAFPLSLPPIGQDLRLTIVSTDVDTPAADAADVRTADDHPLDSIREMLRLSGAAGYLRQKTIRFMPWNLPSVSH
jgi:hypothetical protein